MATVAEESIELDVFLFKKESLKLTLKKESNRCVLIKILLKKNKNKKKNK